MKEKIRKFTGIFCMTITVLFLTVFSTIKVNAHDLAPWANRYNYASVSASGSYHFAIDDCFHINGNTAYYYWANTTTSNLLSASMVNGTAKWGGLINTVQTTASNANVKVIYDPNEVSDVNAFVIDGSNLHKDDYHYGTYNGGPNLIFTNLGINQSSEMKSRIMCHELGHLWGLADIYNLVTKWPRPGLQAIMNNLDDYSSATRHDKNAMRIALNSLYYNTYDGKWKYQKSPGVWAKDEWIAKYGKTNYFDKDGISSYYVNGIIPTTSMNLANGVYEIEGKTSGKLIHTAYATDGSVAHLYTRSVNPDHINNQRFKFTRQSDNTYSIKVLSSNKYLTVPNSSYDNGVQLKFYDWNGSNAQKWYVVSRENTYVKIVNKHSGLAIDIRNNTTSNGTAIQQYTYTDVDAQLFKLVKIS